MSGEADVPDFALVPGFRQRLDGSALREVTLGVVVVDTLMDLPEVEVMVAAKGAAGDRQS